MIPVDQGQRSQATESIDRSITLAAGAGSGKTTVLTERVVNLLQSGVSPSQIAAITFTEKAAGEIRSRVRATLEQRQRHNPHPHLVAALSQFGQLQLSTIHSFCRSILLSESLTAAWAPDTELVYSEALTGLIERCVATWRVGFDHRHPELALLVRVLVSPKAMVEASTKMISYRDLRPQLTDEPYDLELHHSELMAFSHRLQAALETCTNRSNCKLVANNRPFAQLLDQISHLPPGDALMAVILSDVNGSLAGGRAGDWSTGKATYTDVIRDYRQWKTRLFGAIHSTLVADLHTHLIPLVEEQKAASALAEHNDLLFRTQQLLTHHPEVKQRISTRFQYLLIDEVQDTDPLQAEIALLLTREDGATGPWFAHPPQPGRLFAVGDPKQSIYRFRRADVATWNQLVDTVHKDGLNLQLTQNFRSVPGLISWFNHTFSSLEGYQPQVAARAPNPSLSPVVCLPFSDPEQEEEVIARQLLALRASGELNHWSEVMVLLPAWSHGDKLQQALSEAGISASIEGGRGFFSRPEIDVAVRALKAIEEPAFGEDLVVVLRQWFGLTLNDLAEHIAKGGALRYDVPNQPSGVVTAALKVFSSLHRGRLKRSWSELLSDLLDEARVRELWAILPDGAARLANLDKLALVLRELHAAHNTTKEIISNLTKRKQDASDSVQSRDETRHDAVRITSFFKAKGLESKFVVLAYNHRRNMAPSAIIDREHGTYALSLSRDLKPSDWDLLKKVEGEATEEERQRWMYVACTRARDQLILPICAARKSSLTKSFLLDGLPGYSEAEHLDTLAIDGEQTVEVVHFEELAALPRSLGPLGVHTEEVTRLLTEGVSLDTQGDTWVAQRKAAISRSKRACTRFKTVSEMSRRHRVFGGSGLGAEAGTVLHDVLNHLDLKAPLDQRLATGRALLALFAADATLSLELTDQCEERLTALLAHPIFDEIAQSKVLMKEVPFTFTRRSTVIRGVIDCCFATDDEQTQWVVVDWKTDQPAPNSPAAQNYLQQLELYSKALLATITPCTHVRCLLVNGAPEVEEEEDDALELIDDDLRPILLRWLEDNIPMPQVGPDFDGIPVELYWPDTLSVVLDADDQMVADLQALGHTVSSVDTDDNSWPKAVDRLVRQTFSAEGAQR